MKQAGQVFRALHGAPGAFVMPNPWDIGSARILAGLGFKALATTSAGMAFALGKADGQVSPEATLAHCRDLVAATALPVSADLEKGFGDSPESTFETITAAAEIGLAGCSIEDHTGRPEAPIYETALAVERIAAACAPRGQLAQDFVLTARCENLLWGRPDLDDVIKRLQAYQAAGADVLYAPGLRDLSAIRQVCAALDKPVNVVMEGPGAGFSVEQLATAGAKRISLGAALARVAYGALIAAGCQIAQSGRFDLAQDAIGFAELEAYFK